MRICMILEGCYPYVRGGVSSWTDQFIRAMPEHEFILLTIEADSERRGKYKFKLPPNVISIQEIFLDEALRLSESGLKKAQFSVQESNAILKMIQCEDPDWSVLFQCYNGRKVKPVTFLKSEAFFQLLKKISLNSYAHTAFSDLFYTVRSMILPLLFLLSHDVPKANLYHAIATGYSGMLGAMASWKYGSPLMVTEHGIYTREREEEILRSKWVLPDFKTMWIAFFNMLSRCAYSKALTVTSLHERAKKAQIDLGCPPEKCKIISNGVALADYANIMPKNQNGWIDIGAIVRIAPIKDIKTMIYSFAELKYLETRQRLRLHILGDTDDKAYEKECHFLVYQLGLKGVLFVGNTDVRKYIKNLDFTILTSISEGQPLAVIEAMAAGRAIISTDVGSCRELLEGGEGDNLGVCGICVPPMYPQAIAAAMYRLCTNTSLAHKMGKIGRERVLKYYTHERMINQYRDAYRELFVYGWNRI